MWRHYQPLQQRYETFIVPAVQARGPGDESSSKFGNSNSSSSVEEDSSKLASNFLCILKEGEAPLPNHALRFALWLPQLMFCYYLSLA